jgi:hypothetical protein
VTAIGYRLKQPQIDSFGKVSEHSSDRPWQIDIFGPWRHVGVGKSFRIATIGNENRLLAERPPVLPELFRHDNDVVGFIGLLALLGQKIIAAKPHQTGSGDEVVGCEHDPVPSLDSLEQAGMVRHDQRPNMLCAQGADGARDGLAREKRSGAPHYGPALRRQASWREHRKSGL